MSNAEKSGNLGVLEDNLSVDGFLESMVTPEAQLWDEARELTWQTLEAVEYVDAVNHRLVMNDGARLSIGEIAKIIHTGDPEFPLQLIDAEVVGWLEIEYVPENLTELQMEQFESQIEKWVRQHQAASKRHPK